MMMMMMMMMTQNVSGFNSADSIYVITDIEVSESKSSTRARTTALISEVVTGVTSLI
jgi:hypothetical protein